MISLASLIQPGNGNTGPMPDGVVYGLILGGVLLGAGIVFIIVYALTGPARSRKKSAHLRATGASASARVVLLQARPNATGLYDVTLEVATQPPFVVESIAFIPLELIPSVAVGAVLPVRFDPADRAALVIDHPAIACQFN